MSLLLQIIVLACFLALVVVLFLEKQDYLLYAFIFIIIAGAATVFLLETPVIPDADPTTIGFFIEAIDWEVVSFLIAMFTIVEILNTQKVFHEISRRIVVQFKNQIRVMFYFMCVVSTISAAFLEDLSVAIIFGPVIVLACASISINPTPFLLGMTICINLASTLTPFGSAENVLIFNDLDLTFAFFIKNFSVYFVVTTIITLILLDKFILKKYLKEKWNPHCEEMEVYPSKVEVYNNLEIKQEELDSVFYQRRVKVDTSLKKQITNKRFYLNLGAIVVFVVLLVLIDTLWIPTFISLVIFVLINPIRTNKNESAKPSLSFYLRRVDFKLVFFFICLFVLVHLMEVNGTILFVEGFLERVSQSNVFVLSVVILVLTSLFSAFMDNAPVTIMFLPIINILLEKTPFTTMTAPIIIAFVLGINLGGNFLPQGSAPDMMTLEIAKNYCVEDLNYKKLFKVGGLFALLHIMLGIAYIAIYIYVL
ncbi:MAG: anion permease [Candidatus Lokiarchaeota archaeon]|nr:anion permease [Candidatus Lokiarchaeota archaeon]